MEDYIKTTLDRANDLFEKSKIVSNTDENKGWRKNAQFALESALRLTLINLKIDSDGFVVNFSDATPDGNELFLNGRPLGTSIQGLYELTPEQLQNVINGGSLLMPEDAEFKK